MAATLMIAAPRSGSGKTVLTLGLLAALRRQGVAVAAAKVGPDYIDPVFHHRASGIPCLNLDSWAMRRQTLEAHLACLRQQCELLVVEGVMGLFDGAIAAGACGDGSTASLAAQQGWPVLLVLDVSGQAASAAAVARGFASHHPDVRVAGVILNRVAGERHAALLRQAFAKTLPELPVVGTIPRDQRLDIPHRHLGLVQAAEHPEMAEFLAGAADLVSRHLDLSLLQSLAMPPEMAPPGSAAEACSPGTLLQPAVASLAVASDEAFAFSYPAHLWGWRQAGIAVSFFSPLADEAPDPAAGMVFLPGGYPELFAGRLAAAETFRQGLHQAAARGAWIYGECGGFMALGESLVDADGVEHRMASLLPVTSSFARRRLHLGYRWAESQVETAFGPAGSSFRGHEFHYATASLAAGSGLEGRGAASLFRLTDAAGEATPAPDGLAGCACGRVSGSFLHLVDRC